MSSALYSLDMLLKNSHNRLLVSKVEETEGGHFCQVRRLRGVILRGEEIEVGHFGR